MKRECTRCRRPFTPADLARGESSEMEAGRRAAGLEGVRFLYYSCPQCGTNDIFVDVLPRPGESPEDFEARRREMEDVARGLPRDVAEVVVVPVGARNLPA
jgi:hypothetical protein